MKLSLRIRSVIYREVIRCVTLTFLKIRGTDHWNWIGKIGAIRFRGGIKM